MSCTSLARTGLPVVALVGLASVLVVTGAVLILATRKRRSSATTTVVLLLLGISALAIGAMGYTPAHAGTPACGRGSNPGAGSPPSSNSVTGSSGTSDSNATGSSISTVEPPTGSGGSSSRTLPSRTVKASGSTRSASSPSTPSSASSSPPGDGSLTIIQTSTMTGLAPGIAPVAITGTVTNDGTASTFVTTVTVSISSVTKAAGATDGPCDDGDYVLLGVAMPVGQSLAPGESAAFAGARIGFNDRAINQDACRGSVVTLHYVSS